MSYYLSRLRGALLGLKIALSNAILANTIFVMKEKLNPIDFEKKWQKEWLEKQIYKKKPHTSSKTDKFYSLYSFPYPSGDGLHVGHVIGMVTNDIVARYYRMKGYNSVMPMGWDAFGLPAENFAIKTGIHPSENTDKAIETFKKQINDVGIGVDWDTEVGAHREDYYKWTQWIFLQLYKKGLAYQKTAPVNWCPKDQTVLANEQVLGDGTCERCGTQVVQKNLKQWFFKITAFADRLVNDLDNVDWPESTKRQQREWIGKSEGAEIKFGTSTSEIKVFTTRPDTIFGATFIVLSPEHELIKSFQLRIKNWEEVQKYIEQAKNKTDLERQTAKDKTGVKLEGITAINPANEKEIPIFVADYVLASYGAGAIMAVPAHDQRDFEFAMQHNIESVKVVVPKESQNNNEVFEDEGVLINSGQFDNLTSIEAKAKITEWLEKKDFAKKVTIYKLRDWLLSRQRYWGCPIPLVYDPSGNPHPIDEKDLPLKLPTDVDFKPTGESPIARSKEFKEMAEKKYGKGWHYEVDTMDTFVDSSWYFFRHIDSHNSDKIFDSTAANYWLPTDLYMIGAEHIVLHLMYARFFTKFFYDEGLIDFNEPFYRMRHMGLIQGPDGRKMSKRWGNVINPTDEISKYGADTLRMYEMFMGPVEEAKPWNDSAESGVFKFLERVWNLKSKVVNEIAEKSHIYNTQLKLVHKLVQKVEDDIPKLSFNTSVAKFMEFANFMQKEAKIAKDVWEMFLKALAPFAPYITEELWSIAGNNFSIHQQNWPDFNESLTKDEKIKIAVQVNGKTRSEITISANAQESEAVATAMEDDRIKKYVNELPRKVIYVKGRILNLIV